MRHNIKKRSLLVLCILLVVFLALGVSAFSDIVLRVCRNPSCTQLDNYFYLNETVYFDFDSLSGQKTIRALLTYPDISQDELILPASVNLNIVGVHYIDYIDSDSNVVRGVGKSFVVLEKKGDITFPDQCNYNDICEPHLGENYRTCPSDCPSGSADGFCDAVIDGICDPDCDAGDFDCDFQSLKRMFIIALIVIGAIIVFVLFYFEVLRKLTDKKLFKDQKRQQKLDLKNYVISNLERGYTRQQIRQELLKDGWPPKAIVDVFSSIKEPEVTSKMELLQLQNYIKANQKKYSKEKIVKRLKLDGWSDSQIENAFKSLEKQ